MKCIGMEEIQKIESDILSQIDTICRNNNLHYFLLCGSALGAVRHGGPIPWDSDADIGVPMDEFDIFLETVKNQICEKYYIEYCKYNRKSPALHPEIFAKGVDGRVVHVDVFPLFGMPDDKAEQIIHWNKIKKCMWDLHSKRFAYIGNRDDISLKMSVKRAIHYIKCALKYPFLDRSEDIIKTFFELLNQYPFCSSKFSTFPCVGNSERAITETILYGGYKINYDGRELIIPEKYDEYLTQLYGDYMTPPLEAERGFVMRARIYQKEYKKYWAGQGK